MIKFKQTVVTSTARQVPMVTRPPETSPAASAEPARTKRKPAAASKTSETQLSVEFDESSPDKG